MKRKQGFTLIELLIVITILAILVGAALPYVQNYVEESRQAKAKSDLDEIARALVIYESREGEYTKTTVEDLTGRYLDRSPIDPWGVPYVINPESGIVYSTGPDRKDAVADDKFDNIEVSYVPPLALVSCKWIDKNKSGAVDTQNVPDQLMLNFSRKISDEVGLDDLIGAIELNNITNGTTDLLSDYVQNVGDADKPKYVAENKIVVLNLKKDPGTPRFVAGQDSVRVKVLDVPVIKDRATPPNFCIADQNVKILPQ